MVSVVFVRDSAGIHGGVFARAEIAAEYRKLKCIILMHCTMATLWELSTTASGGVASWPEPDKHFATSPRAGQSIRVSFGEVDYSVSEWEDHVDVSVSTLGNVAGDLTYIITPLSLGQAAALYDYHIDEELDSAEPGKGSSHWLSECWTELLVLDMYVRHCTLLLSIPIPYSRPRPGLFGTP